MKGVCASGSDDLFFALLVYFLVEMRYILETGVSSVGNLVQNFIGMSTWTDPLRENSFVQNWTIFYWAYWMAWCVANIFFIGRNLETECPRSILEFYRDESWTDMAVKIVQNGRFSLGLLMEWWIGKSVLYRKIS